MARAPLAVAATLLATLASNGAVAYETNGRHWDAMPVTIYVNDAGAPRWPGGVTLTDLVVRATAVWTDVPCAGVSFDVAGPHDGRWARDGKSTIYWVADEWRFREGAAAATTHLPDREGEPKEVDMALNGVDFEWTLGGGDALETGVLDPVSVIVHELGHVLGLAHSDDPFATMYLAKFPGDAQASLAGDDVRGICSLYPNGTPGCRADLDCDPDAHCETVDGLSACEDARDAIGAPCSKDHLNCAGLCLVSYFECAAICAATDAAFTSGYCAPLCEDPNGAETPCPAGWTCTDVAAAGIGVCLLDAPSAAPMPLATVVIDDAPAKTSDPVEPPLPTPDDRADAGGCGLGGHPGGAGALFVLHALWRRRSGHKRKPPRASQRRGGHRYRELV